MNDEKHLRITDSMQKSTAELAYYNASILIRARREILGRLHNAPSILVIGTQRSDITSSHDLRVQNPAIAGANKKEILFLDWRYGHGVASRCCAQFPYRERNRGRSAGLLPNSPAVRGMDRLLLPAHETHRGTSGT